MRVRCRLPAARWRPPLRASRPRRTRTSPRRSAGCRVRVEGMAEMRWQSSHACMPADWWLRVRFTSRTSHASRGRAATEDAAATTGKAYLEAYAPERCGAAVAVKPVKHCLVMLKLFAIRGAQLVGRRGLYLALRSGTANRQQGARGRAPVLFEFVPFLVLLTATRAYSSIASSRNSNGVIANPNKPRRARRAPTPRPRQPLRPVQPWLDCALWIGI